MHEIKRDQPQFGRRIRQARHQSNLSQVELAKLLGISQESVSRVEGGKIHKGKSVDLLQGFLSSQAGSDDDLLRIVGAIATSEELRSLIIRVLKERS